MYDGSSTGIRVRTWEYTVIMSLEIFYFNVESD